MSKDGSSFTNEVPVLKERGIGQSAEMCVTAEVKRRERNVKCILRKDVESQRSRIILYQKPSQVTRKLLRRYETREAWLEARIYLFGDINHYNATTVNP